MSRALAAVAVAGMTLLLPRSTPPEAEDVLEPLRVAAGPATLRIEARFHPVDSRTPRGTRVDFTAGAGRERRSEFLTTLERYMRE